MATLVLDLDMILPKPKALDVRAWYDALGFAQVVCGAGIAFSILILFLVIIFLFAAAPTVASLALPKSIGGVGLLVGFPSGFLLFWLVCLIVVRNTRQHLRTQDSPDAFWPLGDQ